MQIIGLFVAVIQTSKYLKGINQIIWLQNFFSFIDIHQINGSVQNKLARVVQEK